MCPLHITKVTTLVLITLLVLVAAAPHTIPKVTLGFYSSYTDLSCDMVNGSKEIMVGQCEELSAGTKSVETTYDNAMGTECKLTFKFHSLCGVECKMVESSY